MPNESIIGPPIKQAAIDAAMREAVKRRAARIDAERLRELVHYDPDTGVLTNRVSRSSRAIAGAIAGSVQGNGYVSFRLEGVYVLAHRAAWLYIYGAWPAHEIDHIDGDKTNNAIANLRDVSRTVNSQNQRRPMSTSTSGHLGVSPSRPSCIKPWRARIVISGRQLHLGHYDTQEQAHAAYLEAKRKHHEGCVI